jgi:inner membrane protein
MAGLGHVAVGMAAGRWLAQREDVPAWRPMFALSVLSLAPDADVIAFVLGIPYGAQLGHRGASHSLVIAIALGLMVALLPGPNARVRWRRAAIAILVAASHGLLDSLTDGGLGVALFWPVTAQRFFAPWRPIPVSPIGAGLFSRRGLYVVGFELAAFAPFLLYALWPRRPRAGRCKRKLR